MFKLEYPKTNSFFYATHLSAGFDISANEDVLIYAGDWQVIETGLRIVDVEKIELNLIPEIQIRSRSGISIKHGVTVLGAPCTIDADFRGEIKVPLINLSKINYRIRKGDRIAQGVCILTVRLSCLEVKNVERGIGGFGSTN